MREPESARLEAMNRYAILDTPPEGAFDRLTRLAAQLLEAPLALISIVDERRIWLKSVHGLDGLRELPREPGLCVTAIENDRPYVLEDAARDRRARDNSLVSGPLGIRFYVGTPLITSDGFVLGALAVLDTKLRLADPVKVALLTDLAEIVVDELELRLASRSSLTDELTGLANRRALERELDRHFDALERGATFDGAVAVLDVDGLKAVNDRSGHDVGDALLRAFGGSLADAFRGHGLFRYGGDEFVVLFETALAGMQARAGISLAVRAVRQCGFPSIDASCGVAAYAEAGGSPRDALRLADSRMYAAKVSRR
ncbi:MAG: sensor domain-containing diguanylate cyclase [Candidatus Eremiobacteraeota bacterium]|nr:sensor domain-containing diguanylate cyclase [Candidatus Eremiobacteraeota bacterium]